MRTRSSNAIPRVRELAGRWSTPDLEACLADVIKSGSETAAGERQAHRSPSRIQGDRRLVAAFSVVVRLKMG